MKTLNDDLNQPLRFILGDTIYGQIHNSWDKHYHLVKWERPYLTDMYICGKRGNMSPSRNESESRIKCPKCFEILKLREGYYDQSSS